MTASSKERMKDAIVQVVRTWANPADPRILLSIADRESAFNPTAEADVAVAKRVWARLKPSYVEHANPYTAQDSDWEASRGLYQLMVPYHLSKWSWVAHPLALEHPVVATVTAGRLVYAALLAGAKNAVDVRMIWAFGSDGLSIPHTDSRYTDRVRAEQSRMAKLGFSPSLALAPLHASDWAGFGRGEQASQNVMAMALSNRLGLDPWAGSTISTPDTTPETPSSVGLLLAAALAWGFLRG